ncbi:type VI secretion system baseplate subunit TssF [Salmonella enterica]|uniref:type VI secretion system baseplate subunit TssF n=1 Tax=Salmonella enterica TaxID=28901 RepID=UPI000B53A70F|nr:type VI secretion system baseplate subunit TssF [Salmonella enterica]ECC1573924.1 type VI secretion system baseplate subunit TssF [Salmonella enterica subsp. diarizonae]ASG84169.1 type VI secretion system ImpG/VasA family protein [Salmonella enterica subsp. diarizonae serovar 65:c:z str. SA20044251]EBA7038435.1 type VI secretion system baseplate subunit TssF [Salmonella enterica]ECO7559534.1 type VI secretion system baseplate subunit TssF [Salmonella enterica]EDT8784897.1 type VI secretion 
MSDHDFLRYYDSEMRYLKEAAKEFAQQFPDTARQLGIDSMSLKTEESVEQLFQGFAFMMAQVRRKIDDDIPELTEPVLSQLLPVVNRTLPSTAVVELTPDEPDPTREMTLPAGTELLSLPVSTMQYQRGNRCPYRTVNDLVLYPFQLATVSRYTRTEGGHALRLRFTVTPQNDERQLVLRDIPLYLNGERPLQAALYLALSRHIRHVRVRYSGDTELYPLAATFTPQWTTPQPALWPESDSPALCGEVRPLLEYFSSPQRYFFMLLSSSAPLTLPPHCSHFELDIALSELLPLDMPVPEDAIRMHCVPVINLFRLAGEPLVTQPAQLDYRLQPHRLTDGHTEIYSVDTVSQKDEEDETEYPYVAYRHFRHKGGMLRYEKEWPERFFHTRTWRGVSGLHETLLMLGGRTHEQLPGVRLLLNLTCTNGAFPRMSLQQALFDAPYQTGNLALNGRTRSFPSRSYYPPTRPRYQWEVMSLLHPRALSFLIDNAENLRHAIGQFDWTGEANNQRRINGITAVSYRQAFNASHQWHGVRIRVELDETQFSGMGDARLFSELLEQFFTQYASVIRFTQLTVTLTESKTEWTWPERRIHRVLM